MIESISKKVSSLKIQLEQARKNLNKETQFLTVESCVLECQEEAQRISQNIAREIQQQVHNKVSKIVTRCLEAVFVDDPYEFAIRFDCKRGKTDAKLIFIRDGIELDDPVNQVGGGVIDVASLALRLSCILLSRPVRRRLLVLDEPLKNVRGKQNRKNVRSLLEALSKEMEVQIILNVDIDSYPEFVFGSVLEMG